MKLFIDTNIYFAFIKASNEKLTSLDVLIELCINKEVILLFPRITQDEFYRNYDKIAHDYCDVLDSYLQARELAFASAIKDKDIKKRIKKLHDDLSQALKECQDIYLQSVSEVEAKIQRLIRVAYDVEETDSLIQKAWYRRLTGNPPGKSNDPFGDAIAWETILQYATGDDVTIISKDKDKGWWDAKKEKIHLFC